MGSDNRGGGGRRERLANISGWAGNPPGV
jgi:hypothetical protein